MFLLFARVVPPKLRSLVILALEGLVPFPSER